MQWQSNLLKRTHTTHTHTSEQTGDMYQLLGISKIAHVSWILVRIGFEPPNVIPRFQAAVAILDSLFFLGRSHLSMAFVRKFWVLNESVRFIHPGLPALVVDDVCSLKAFCIWQLKARLQMLHKRTQRTPESNKTCVLLHADCEVGKVLIWEKHVVWHRHLFCSYEQKTCSFWDTLGLLKEIAIEACSWKLEVSCERSP